MENTISYNEFRNKIGWTPNNYPYSVSKLNLVNGNSGVKLGGALINGTHYNVYYNENILGGIVYFPILFENGSKYCKVQNAAELDAFLNGSLPMIEGFSEKKETLRELEYNQIRMHEISQPNRIVFSELYSWSKEQFYGYQFVEC